MKCKHAHRMIVDHVNGFLRPEEIRILYDHLNNCNFCRQELEKAEKVLDRISNVKVQYPPESVWDSFSYDLHKRIESEAALTFKKNQRQRFYFLPGWAASIATAILVIFTSILLTYHPSSSSIKINESKVTKWATDAKPILDKYNSEPNLVVDIISDVLITETELAQLKELESFSQSENLFYNYEEPLDDVLVELDSIKNNEGLIQSLLNNELSEFDDSQIIDPSIGEHESM